MANERRNWRGHVAHVDPEAYRELTRDEKQRLVDRLNAAVNARRAERGLPPLKKPTLCTEARSPDESRRRS